MTAYQQLTTTLYCYSRTCQKNEWTKYDTSSRLFH